VSRRLRVKVDKGIAARRIAPHALLLRLWRRGHPGARSASDAAPGVTQAHAQPILPPVEYDKPYDGDLTIKMVATLEELRERCGTRIPKMLACAFHNSKSCVIYLVEDSVMRQRGWTTGILLRHETGHCNGWPGDHPGERALPWPITHFVPVPDRINR
jgi:hypothetical protein